MKTFLFFLFYSLCFSRIGISQNINKDSVSFVHFYGMIDENDSLSVLLANELYRISVNAKEENIPYFMVDRISIVTVSYFFCLIQRLSRKS